MTDGADLGSGVDREVDEAEIEEQGPKSGEILSVVGGRKENEDFDGSGEHVDLEAREAEVLTLQINQLVAEKFPNRDQVAGISEVNGKFLNVTRNISAGYHTEIRFEIGLGTNKATFIWENSYPDRENLTELAGKWRFAVRVGPVNDSHGYTSTFLKGETAAAFCHEQCGISNSNELLLKVVESFTSEEQVRETVGRWLQEALGSFLD